MGLKILFHQTLSRQPEMWFEISRACNCFPKINYFIDMSLSWERHKIDFENSFNGKHNKEITSHSPLIIQLTHAETFLYLLLLTLNWTSMAIITFFPLWLSWDNSRSEVEFDINETWIDLFCDWLSFFFSPLQANKNVQSKLLNR